ncbi:MAG: glutamyl-tRNA reductase [Gemmataceae bacterium]|nr:glutamyl-tRNA reductase [Gemmataceae bacterium]
MKLLLVGCNYKTAPIELREKLAFDGAKLTAALRELETRYGCEAVILSTCNRVELYLARAHDQPLPDHGVIAEFLSETHQVPVDRLVGDAARAACAVETATAAAQGVSPTYALHNVDVIRHLFRVVASLDSLIVGEGQIAGQVKRAYEQAHAQATAGPILHALFQHANIVAKRVRTETGISRGHVSVSSVAVDYVRQVFDHFDDKTVLVIGAGKMGELTLKHLRDLKPRRILVTNRSPEKASAVAAGCDGQAMPWEELDDALVEADIVLSTTGAPEPIMPRRRFNGILARRENRTMVILDIAVPRDFDPRIHDGDRACLFNIDDLQRIREQTLHERHKHIAPAEAIIEQEVTRFHKDWMRRRHGKFIAQLTQEFEARRKAVVEGLMADLNGAVGPEDRAKIEYAFRKLQNQFLHGPISALADDAPEPGRHTLLEALRKMFRLEE